MHLAVRHATFYEGDVKHLIKHSPGMESLEIYGSLISDEAVITIANHLPELKRLGLSKTKVGDTGVFYVGHDLEGLEGLELDETKVTDASLRYVAGKAKNLQSLHVSQTSVTARTLQALKDNQVMADLVVYGCQVGDEGRMRSQAMLAPN